MYKPGKKRKRKQVHKHRRVKTGN